MTPKSHGIKVNIVRQGVINPPNQLSECDKLKLFCGQGVIKGEEWK